MIDTGYISVIVFGAIASTLLSAAVVGLTFFVPLRWILARRLKRSATAFQRQLDDIAQQASTLQQRLPPSVFLKPIGDEAALALNWTSAMAALMQGASNLLFIALHKPRDRWTRMPRPLRTAAALLLTAGWSIGTVWILVTIWGVDSWTSALVNETLRFDYFSGGGLLAPVFSISVIWALLASAALLLLVCALTIVLLIALLAAAGAGLPSLTAGLYMSTSVDAIPRGTHRLVLLDVSSPSALAPAARPGLKHSAVYLSPGAIGAVIESLEGFESARAASV